MSRVAVGYVVTIAWFVSLLAGFVTSNYHGLELVTPIMLVYVSFLYGDGAIKRYLKVDREAE